MVITFENNLVDKFKSVPLYIYTHTHTYLLGPYLDQIIRVYYILIILFWVSWRSLEAERVRLSHILGGLILIRNTTNFLVHFLLFKVIYVPSNFLVSSFLAASRLFGFSFLFHAMQFASDDFRICESTQLFCILLVYTG